MARLAYRLDLGASMYVPELDEALDAWVCGTLWNAVWDPGIMTMAEARRPTLARPHGADEYGPRRRLPAVRHLGHASRIRAADRPTLLRRFGLSESDMDRLEIACLKHDGRWWRMATDDAHEVEWRLRDA